LNRHWRDTNPWAQPGLHAVKAFLIGLEKEHPVDFCFDIHAHSLATGAFMYGNVVSEDQQSEQQAQLRYRAFSRNKNFERFS